MGQIFLRTWLGGTWSRLVFERYNQKYTLRNYVMHKGCAISWFIVLPRYTWKYNFSRANSYSAISGLPAAYPILEGQARPQTNPSFTLCPSDGARVAGPRETCSAICSSNPEGFQRMRSFGFRFLCVWPKICRQLETESREGQRSLLRNITLGWETDHGEKERDIVRWILKKLMTQLWTVWVGV